MPNGIDFDSLKNHARIFEVFSCRIHLPFPQLEQAEQMAQLSELRPVLSGVPQEWLGRTLDFYSSRREVSEVEQRGPKIGAATECVQMLSPEDLGTSRQSAKKILLRADEISQMKMNFAGDLQGGMNPGILLWVIPAIETESTAYEHPSLSELMMSHRGLCAEHKISGNVLARVSRAQLLFISGQPEGDGFLASTDVEEDICGPSFDLELHGGHLGPVRPKRGTGLIEIFERELAVVVNVFDFAE